MYTFMETVTRRELEECVLKKYDQNAAGIIATAPLAAAYVFDREIEKWEKLNCEGILFLYRKTYEPNYNLFLLNRLNNSHLYQPINRHLKLQVDNSYLLFKNETGTIYGFWIYDKKYFNKICDEIKRILCNINLHSYRINGSGKNQEVSKMLQKTEEEYLKAYYGLKNLRIEKENGQVSTPNSVTKFFENASKVFKNNKPVQVALFKENCSNENMKNLIRNPEYNVESIEKNQRYSYLVEEI